MKKYLEYSSDELSKLSPIEFKEVWDNFIIDGIFSKDGKILYLNSDVKEKIEKHSIGFYLYTDSFRAHYRLFKEGQTEIGGDIRISQQNQTSQSTYFIIIDFIPSTEAKIVKYDDKIRETMCKKYGCIKINDGGGREWIQIPIGNPTEVFYQSFLETTKQEIVVDQIRESYTRYIENSPSNSKAWKAILKARKEGRTRYTILKHCGTRKTMDQFKSMNEIYKNEGKLITMLGAPLNNLLNQHHNSFIEEDKALGIHGSVAYLGIASVNIVDKKLHPDYLEEIDKDKSTLLSFANKNSPNEIKKWIDSKLQDNNIKQIRIFFNYDSSDIVVKGLCDYIIDYCAYDECDWLVGNNKVRKLTTNDNNGLVIKERAFYTASPRNYSDEGMNSENIFGPVILKYTHKMGVGDGVICDYKVLTLGAKDSDVKRMVNINALLNVDLGDRNEEVTARIITTLIALDNLVGMKKELEITDNLNKFVSFHSRNNRAKVFAEMIKNNKDIFPNLNKYKVFTAKGGDEEETKKTLIEYKGEKHAILCNCRIFGVGFDAPELELVIFVDPKGSIQGIIQAVGRVQRKSKNKKFGYVLLPVNVDDNGRVIRNKIYEDMLYILARLSESNEFLYEEIMSGNNGGGGTRNRRLIIPQNINIDLDTLKQELTPRIFVPFTKEDCIEALIESGVTTKTAFQTGEQIVGRLQLPLKRYFYASQRLACYEEIIEQVGLTGRNLKLDVETCIERAQRFLHLNSTSLQLSKVKGDQPAYGWLRDHKNEEGVRYLDILWPDKAKRGIRKGQSRTQKDIYYTPEYTENEIKNRGWNFIGDHKNKEQFNIKNGQVLIGYYRQYVKEGKIIPFLKDNRSKGARSQK